MATVTTRPYKPGRYGRCPTAQAEINATAWRSSDQPEGGALNVTLPFKLKGEEACLRVQLSPSEARALAERLLDGARFATAKVACRVCHAIEGDLHGSWCSTGLGRQVATLSPSTPTP